MICLVVHIYTWTPRVLELKRGGGVQINVYRSYWVKIKVWKNTTSLSFNIKYDGHLIQVSSGICGRQQRVIWVQFSYYIFAFVFFPPDICGRQQRVIRVQFAYCIFFFFFVSLWHGFSWMYIIGSNINLAFDKRKSRYNVYFVYLQKLDIDISNIVLLLFFCWRVIFLNIYNIYFRFKYTYLIWESLDTMYMYTCIFTDIDI